MLDYNGNRAFGTQPIDTAVLKIDKEKYEDIVGGGDPDPEHISEVMTPLNEERFFVMGYNPQRDAYISVTDST